MSAPGAPRGPRPAPDVVLAVEQLRRPVPGGIGRYAAALLGGLRDIGAPGPLLLASRPRPGVDPLAAWGFEVRASRLPAPWLTLAWDRGLAAAPRGADDETLDALVRGDSNPCPSGRKMRRHPTARSRRVGKRS